MKNVPELRKDTFKDLIYKFLFCLLFFPSMTFGILPSEVFPYAILAALIITPISFILSVFISLFLVGLVILVCGINSNYFLALWSYGAFLNGIFGGVIYYSLDNYKKQLFNKSLRIAYYILILTPLIQIILPTYISEVIFQFFVPRAKVDAPFLGGLSSIGVSSFSSEPSRAGLILIFTHAMIWHLNIIDKRKRIYFDITIFIIIFFLNRSATGAGFYIIYLLSILNYRYYFFAIIPLFFLMILEFSPENYEFESKGLTFLWIFLVEFYNSDLNQIITKIIQFGGTRFHGNFVTLIDLPFLGFGLGNWELGSYTLLEKYPFLWKSSFEFNSGLWGPRPTSYITAYILEGGIFIFIITLILIIMTFILGKEKTYFNKSLILPLFSLIFLGEIGLPVITMCFVLILINKKL